MRDFKFNYHLSNVDSSAIDKLWYSVESRELVVRYRDSQTLAGWSNVPPETVDHIVTSASIGRDLNILVKNNRERPGFNTDLINFVDLKAQERARRITVDAPVQKIRYQVAGLVLKPTVTSEFIEAESLEDAMKQFADKHGSNLQKITAVAER